MIPSAQTLAELTAQLNLEFQAIEENWELNTQAWQRIQEGASHQLDWSALGYTLHTVYTAMENYFLRICKAFENNLPTESGHRELLQRMELEIPGLRPALLDRETARALDQLRAFRHVFRNLYDDRLDPERLTILQRRAGAVRGAFQAAHVRYLERLADLALSSGSEG